MAHRQAELGIMVTFVQGAFVDLKGRLRNGLFLKITSGWYSVVGIYRLLLLWRRGL